MGKTEIQALKELLRTYKSILKKETDPIRQHGLKLWIKGIERELDMHKFARS